MNIEIKDLEVVFHIPEPWYIDRCLFDEKLKQLNVYLKFRAGSLFGSAGCDAEAEPLKDIEDYDQIWRHLNFAEYSIYFHAEHPRTNYGRCIRIFKVNVPSTVKPRAGFNLLFDA
ncbi:hypothetical protein [Marinicrinis sediminis]|uniref:Uncharacterized protein n=1 Tax=Marinicrinis sediminis TaxID=1652465 RepID=A0ABW5R751_9BACL